MAARRATENASRGGVAAETPSSLYLVYGDDEYFVSSHAKKVVNGLCPDPDDSLGLETIDGQASNVSEAALTIRHCLEALQTMGLFGERKVVWLRDANFLPGSDKARNADVKAKLEELTALIKSGLSADQVLVVSAQKVDGRSAFLKACQANGRVKEFSVPQKAYQAEDQAREVASKLFQRSGLSVAGNVLTAFIEKTGTETRQIVQEVEKLTVYLADRKDVRLEDIRFIVSSSREAIAWDFADAVGHRDLSEALYILRQLMFQNESPVGLIIGLERRFRELIVLRESLDKHWLSLVRKGNWTNASWHDSAEAEATLSMLSPDPRTVNAYRTAKLAEQARKFSIAELLASHALIVTAHERMVTSAVPQSMQLEFLLLRILGNKMAASSKRSEVAQT